jgi:hypothetical protein
MTKVSLAIGTNNFCSSAIGIRHIGHMTFDFLIKTGPTAPGTEFIFRSIQRMIALPTRVNTFFIKFVVLSGEWSFGSFI